MRLLRKIPHFGFYAARFCKIAAFVLFLGIQAVNAKDDVLEVSADRFVANERSQIVELIDNVHIKKGKDELFAKKVIIKVDKNRLPLNYSAYGGVTFSITTQDKRHFKGRANEAFYDAKTSEYRLIGNGELKEDNDVNIITGDEIVINNDAGYLNITGDKKRPAKLIFQLDDTKKSKQNGK